MKTTEIINELQQVYLDTDLIREIEIALIKAEKWDKLDAEIGEYYLEDED